MSSKTMSIFDRSLKIGIENFEIGHCVYDPIEVLDFLLNPRRLRGSDFLMRWSQGVWSEERIIEAVNNTSEYYAIRYGPSSTAPDNDIRAFELYFERLELAGLSKYKRPDLLIFKKDHKRIIDHLVSSLGGVEELPFTPEFHETLQELLSKALVAVECENSLWKGKSMPDFGVELRPQKRLKGRLGLKKNAVLPTIILKEEDREPLLKWQHTNNIPIHIWHVFYDMAFGISLVDILDLIEQGLILPSEQTFQSPSGAVTRKTIYKIYYHYAYPLCDALQEPELKARVVEDKNGHVLPYVHFEGGKMVLRKEVLDVLRGIESEKN